MNYNRRGPESWGEGAEVSTLLKWVDTSEILADRVSQIMRLHWFAVGFSRNMNPFRHSRGDQYIILLCGSQSVGVWLMMTRFEKKTTTHISQYYIMCTHAEIVYVHCTVYRIIAVEKQKKIVLLTSKAVVTIRTYYTPHEIWYIPRLCIVG